MHWNSFVRPATLWSALAAVALAAVVIISFVSGQVFSWLANAANIASAIFAGRDWWSKWRGVR